MPGQQLYELPMALAGGPLDPSSRLLMQARLITPR
jgi:hypothetical protein